MKCIASSASSHSCDSHVAAGQVVLHVAVILNLNNLYQSIAHWLTDLENPRTELEYENNVIIKRFFFEAFDCYIALFYLAFFQFDVVRLRLELTGATPSTRLPTCSPAWFLPASVHAHVCRCFLWAGMYTTDSLRRMFLETIIPLVLATFSKKSKKKKIVFGVSKK